MKVIVDQGLKEMQSTEKNMKLYGDFITNVVTGNIDTNTSVYMFKIILKALNLKNYFLEKVLFFNKIGVKITFLSLHQSGDVKHKVKQMHVNKFKLL